MKRKIAAAMIITSLVTWDAESVEAAAKKKTIKVQDVSVKNVIAPAMLNYDGNILENAIVFASSTHSSTSVTAITDNNLKSAWNSGGYAPAWIEISVPVNLRKYPINFLKITPTQDPAGTTKHIISAKVSGAWTNVQTVHQYTSDGKTIIVELSKPITNAEKIKIETVDSPSWVAWYEISAHNRLYKYIMTTNNNCYVYDQLFDPSDSVSWSGSCKDGYAHGTGTLQWYVDNKISGKYQGEMLSGKRHGIGTYIWGDGSSFEGKWVDDKQSGLGLMINTDGSSYRGGMLVGKRHGSGTYKWGNGRTYEGNWINNKQNGFGVLFDSDGSISKKGLWDNGEFTRSCSSHDGCIALASDIEQIKRLDKEFKCEQARDIDNRLDAKDRFFNYSQCDAERTLNSHLASKNPQSMYLAAGQYERDGSTYNAQKVYNSLIQRFPNSQWSIKANDRLLSIKSDSDASNRQSEFESNRRQEARKASEDCKWRKASCYISCDKIKDWKLESSCKNRCDADFGSCSN